MALFNRSHAFSFWAHGMKTVYQPGHLVEAHMLAHLLRQAGFSPFIQGEHLAGGVGELPAAGLLRLDVPSDEYPAARALIERWEAQQPPDLAPTQDHQAQKQATRRSAWMGFVSGVVVGVGVTLTALRLFG